MIVCHYRSFGLSLLIILKSNLVIEAHCLHCKLRKDTFFHVLDVYNVYTV